MSIYAKALIDLDFFNYETKIEPAQERCDRRNKLFQKKFKKICSIILNEKIVDEEDKAMLHVVHGISEIMDHIGKIEEISGIKPIIYNDPKKMFKDILKIRSCWVDSIDNPVRELIGFLVTDFSKDINKGAKKYFAISIKNAKKYSPCLLRRFYRALLAQALFCKKLDLDKIGIN